MTGVEYIVLRLKQLFPFLEYPKKTPRCLPKELEKIKASPGFPKEPDAFFWAGERVNKPLILSEANIRMEAEAIVVLAYTYLAKNKPDNMRKKIYNKFLGIIISKTDNAKTVSEEMVILNALEE
ncbi:hypothetical protein ACFL2B_02520 [Patescibacteria group bacterium]